MSSFGSFEEFWASSSVFFERLKRGEQMRANRQEGRGNDVQPGLLRQAQEQTNRQMPQTDAHLDRLESMITTLAERVSKRAMKIEAHERRSGLECLPE